MPTIRAGVLSVILVNFRGADDTIAAVTALSTLDWPQDRLEIVVVENGSGDDSAARLRDAVPRAHLVVSETNLGFAGGCNLGARESSGEYLAFLNNDARTDPLWARAAIQEFERSPRTGAVASRVLDWDGKRVDFVGAGATWYGMGYKPATGERPPRDSERAHDVLFGTGSSMFARQSVFQELGGFDERYFMFFEDVDFGWRLNLAGWHYRYVPESLAFHKHHASMSKLGAFKETYLLERNALYTLYKNLGDAELSEKLPAALLLSVRRGVDKGALDTREFEISRGGSDRPGDRPVSKESLASLYAIDQFVENLPSLSRSRDEIQASRVVSDQQIRSLFVFPDVPGHTGKNYLEGYMKIADAFDVLDDVRPTRVLVITGDPIGARLAGPAIRAWNIAATLSSFTEVRLLSTTLIEQGLVAPFELHHVDPGMDRLFSPHEAWADVIVFQGHALEFFESLPNTSKILVADIYDPMHLEQLEQARELGSALWHERVDAATGTLNEQLLRADFFICASERQRSFYLGQLAALGRLNPETYENDPDFRGLLDVVPFGLPSSRPEVTRPVLRDVREGFASDDKIVIWSGGLYNWFDPKTLVRAVAMLAQRRPEVRLFFQGVKHPHPGVPEMAVVGDTRALSAELGVLDRNVFINGDWVEYSDRGNYLLEADAGVSTHHAHIETTFSFRTRILDYLWAELPMVVTDGDVFADLVRDRELGVVVPAEDVVALANALERVLYDSEFIARVVANIGTVREEFLWEESLRPLVDFVRAPHVAADRSRRVSARARSGRVTTARTGFRHDLSRARHYLRNGGVMVVAGKVLRRIRRR